MAKLKYAELVIPVDHSLPRSFTGMVIVSDYTSGGSRHLFLKRNTTDAVSPAPAAKRNKKNAAAAPGSHDAALAQAVAQ